VSPSTTLASPNKSSDRAVPHEAESGSRAIDPQKAQCCIAVRKRFCGAGLKNIVDSVVSLHGAEVSELTQNKLLNYIQLLASIGKTDEQLLTVGAALDPDPRYSGC
jgi:hypothetical protein